LTNLLSNDITLLQFLYHSVLPLWSDLASSGQQDAAGPRIEYHMCDGNFLLLAGDKNKCKYDERYIAKAKTQVAKR
jgi:hypothetical protein